MFIINEAPILKTPNLHQRKYNESNVIIYTSPFNKLNILILDKASIVSIKIKFVIKIK